VSAGTPAAAWEVLRYADAATTYANGAQTTTIADDGDGYLLLTSDDDGTVGDYPSRMKSVAWTLPARVNAVGPGGYGVLLRATLDTQPALGTAFNFGIGLTDGDPGVSGAATLIAGLRYTTTNGSLYASKRGGGGADKVEVWTTPATLAEVYVSPSASQIHLNQIDVYGLDAARTANTDATIQQQDNTAYTAPLQVLLAWGRDSNTSSGAVSLRAKFEALWYQLPY
jgi:hypothetical protein